MSLHFIHERNQTVNSSLHDPSLQRILDSSTEWSGRIRIELCNLYCLQGPNFAETRRRLESCSYLIHWRREDRGTDGRINCWIVINNLLKDKQKKLSIWWNQTWAESSNLWRNFKGFRVNSDEFSSLSVNERVPAVWAHNKISEIIVFLYSCR